MYFKRAVLFVKVFKVYFITCTPDTYLVYKVLLIWTDFYLF